MKRRNYLAGILLAVPFMLSAQIRSYVGIVTENYKDETVSFLEKTRDDFRSDGYISYASSINEYLDGHFGSGFVYVAKDSRCYIVTNRHVVSQAKTVTVEFENEDGTKTKYEGLTVAAADENLDVALLAFPEDTKPFKQGLQFVTAAVKDGDDIWSAGFPGLAGKPAWQLGKGSVTNAAARVEELADPKVTTLIQHSAQVDGGNSGGPLLIRDDKAVAGYRVAGINAWKVVGRQATNISIPAAAVEKFIDCALSGKFSTDENAARESAFTSAAASAKEAVDYQYLAKYISIACAENEGYSAFKKTLAKAPSAVRGEAVGLFDGYSPVEAFRYSIAYATAQNIAALKDGSTWKGIWVQEDGYWRLSATSAETAQNSKTGTKKSSKTAAAKSAFAFSDDGYANGLALEGRMAFDFSHSDNIEFGGDIQLLTSNIFAWQFLFDHGNGDLKYNFGGFGIQISLPFAWDNHLIAPYIGGAFGVSFYDKTTTEYGGTSTKSAFSPGNIIEAGVRYSVNTDWDVKLLLNAGWRLSNLFNTAFDNNKYGSFNSFVLSVGVGF